MRLDIIFAHARVTVYLLRSLPAAYAYLELRRTLRHTSTPDILYILYKQKNRASWTTKLDDTTVASHGR